MFIVWYFKIITYIKKQFENIWNKCMTKLIFGKTYYELYVSYKKLKKIIIYPIYI